MRVAIIAKARNGPMIAYRQRFNLNQTKAAKLAGVSLESWMNLEGMKFNKVSVKVINKIADTLGVHPNVIAPPEIRGEHLKWAETAFADIDSKYLLEHIGNPQIVSHTDVDILPEDEVANQDMKERMSEILMTLNYRQREVMKLRYGIPDGDPLTLEKIGKKFGISGHRVRQIEAKALQNLQHPTRSEKIAGFLP